MQPDLLTAERGMTAGITCGVNHRIDELEFAGCAACAWRAYHEANDSRVAVGAQLSEANLERAALTARLTVLEAALRERDRAIDDALCSMREPMTLRDAQLARGQLTRCVVKWKKAAARAALEGQR